MDLGAKIINTGELYVVDLPCICGYFEGIYKNYDNIVSRHSLENIDRFLDVGSITASLHHIFLMSSIGSSLCMRIVDVDDIARTTHSIFMKHGKIETFTLREKDYFVILYEALDGRIRHYTSFTKNILFQSYFENSTFYIHNILSGQEVFSMTYDTKSDEYTGGGDATREQINQSQVYIYIPDLLDTITGREYQLEEYKSVLHQFEVSIEEIGEDIFLTQAKIDTETTEKILGFFGNHQIIRQEKDSTKKYCSFGDIEDFNISLPENFIPSEDLNLHNPEWNIMRMKLLELIFLIHTLKTYQKNLSTNITEMKLLNIPQIQFQKIHAQITETNILQTIKLYESTFTQFTTLLKTLLT